METVNFGHFTVVLPEARIRMQFVGKPLPQLRSISFEIDGTATPGKLGVNRRGKKGIKGVSWCPSTKALAAVLVMYRLQGLKYHIAGKDGDGFLFDEPIDSRPYMKTLWEAVNSPNIINDIFGLDEENRPICKRVFCPHAPSSGRTFEVFSTVLPHLNVQIEWDQWISETEAGLIDLLELLEAYFKSYKRRRQILQSETTFLKLAEAVRGIDAPKHRISLSKLIELNQQGLAARIRHGREDVFMTPRLGIVSALIENKNCAEDIIAYTSLKPSVVSSELTRIKERVSSAGGIFHLKPEKWDCIIFDWTDTLVDEYHLDEALCEFIPRDVTPEKTAVNDARFTHLLNELEAIRSKRWYDYVYLGGEFGKSESELHAETKRHYDKIHPLCDIPALLRTLNEKGVMTVLATNCHSTILEWRAKMLGVSLGDFDLVLTSDQVDDVRDKKAYLDQVIRKLKIKPSHAAVVSDDVQKDLLPAKALGFKTVWVIAEPHQHGHKSFSEPQPRFRGKYGSPTLPADTNLFHITRERVLENVVDYCVPCADRVLRLIV